MSDMNVINQILSLMKENNISNKDILQSNISTDDSKSLQSIRTITSSELTQFKKYLKPPTVISGTRLYVLGDVATFRYGDAVTNYKILSTADYKNVVGTINQKNYDCFGLENKNYVSTDNNTSSNILANNGSTYHYFMDYNFQNNNSNFSKALVSIQLRYCVIVKNVGYFLSPDRIGYISLPQNESKNSYQSDYTTTLSYGSLRHYFHSGHTKCFIPVMQTSRSK